MQRRQESLDSKQQQQATKSNRLAPFKRSTTINVAGGSLQDLKEAHKSSWIKQHQQQQQPQRPTPGRNQQKGRGGGGGVSSSARRMFQAGSAGLLLAQNQHISQLSIHSQSSNHPVDIFPDQQLASMFALHPSHHHQISSSSTKPSPAAHHQDSYQPPTSSSQAASNLGGHAGGSNNNIAASSYSSAHRAGLDSSNSAISSEQLANDQERADRPSCLQIMRKLFFSLLLGIIIAICWVLIIHTLKWIAIRGNEFVSMTNDELAAANSAMAHRSLILTEQPLARAARRASSPAPASASTLFLGNLKQQLASPANQSSVQQQQQQNRKQQNRTQPSSQLLKHETSQKSAKLVKRTAAAPGNSNTSSSSSSNGGGENENGDVEDDDDNSDDSVMPQPNPQPSIVFDGRDDSSSSAEHKRGGQQTTRKSSSSQSQMRHQPSTTTTSTESAADQWPAVSPAERDATISAGGDSDGLVERGLDGQRPAKAGLSSLAAVGLAYRAPFFTSWFVSTWNILFMPVFTLISSCCFRNEDSNTKKLLVRESISQFMDNGLTTLQFLGRCAFFSVLWISTIFGIVYSLYNIDATLVMALFACSATLVYLLSWVLLHQQFVGVRIVAVIICTTGIALLAYMDNSRTLGSVLMVAGSALCSAVYKVIYQRMFGFWSIAQMSLFFTLIGLFNAFLMWPIALLLYFLGVELIVWRYIPWMHLIAAGALHLSANILAYFGPICSYDIFLTLGLLFAVVLSAAIDVNFYKITFAGMKLAGVLLLMIGFLVCLLPENWNEFLYDLVNERFVRWKKQRSMKKSRNKVQDLSTGQTSRLRTPSGRVK